MHDRAGLLKALRSNTAGTAVVIRASSSELAAELLDEVDWQSGHLFLVGTGDAEARIRAESVPWLSWVRVRHVDLEFVPPRIVESGPGHARLTGGLGLVELSGTSSDTAPRRAPEIPVARLLPGLESALLPPRIAAQQLAEESERRLVAERVVELPNRLSPLDPRARAHRSRSGSLSEPRYERGAVAARTSYRFVWLK